MAVGRSVTGMPGTCRLLAGLWTGWPGGPGAHGDRPTRDPAVALELGGSWPRTRLSPSLTISKILLERFTETKAHFSCMNLSCGSWFIGPTHSDSTCYGVSLYRT